MITYTNEDCMIGMDKLKGECIDLTVTSPPYDNLRMYNGFAWDYKNVADSLYRVTKPGGIVVWVVNDSVIDGSETGSSFRQALYFMEIGFNLHDTMIYAKTNPIPLTHNRYEQAFEYMFVFSKGKTKTFNPLVDKCVTFGKYNQRRKTGRVKEASTKNRDEVTDVNETKYRTNIWEYVVGIKQEQVKHPAVFPLQLAKDHILSWSNEGDTVFDPFTGSGTTGIACIDLNRNFIGFEIDKNYYAQSKQRLEDFQKQIRL